MIAKSYEKKHTNAVNDTDITQWSEAQKRVSGKRDTNLNAYLYRFNMPGDTRKNGKWSASEHKIFMETLKTHGANYKWGEFSLHVPGRVGYQCCNYYRFVCLQVHKCLHNIGTCL